MGKIFLLDDEEFCHNFHVILLSDRRRPINLIIHFLIVCQWYTELLLCISNSMSRFVQLTAPC